MGGQYLHAPVRHRGVGVHNPGGHLDQLSGVPHQKHLPNPLLHRHVDGSADVIAALHRPVQIQPQAFPHKGLAVISRGQHQRSRSPGRLLPDIQADGGQQGRLAHGLHDARGAQYGDSSPDSQAAVKGIQRPRLPLRGKNHNPQRPRKIPAGADPLHVLKDHVPGHRVNGMFPHFAAQSGLCNESNPHSALYFQRQTAIFTFIPPTRRFRLRRRNSHPGANLHAVGHVRVVPAVLADRAAHPAGGPPYLLHAQKETHPARRLHRNLFHGFLPQQHGGSCHGSRCRASACGVSAP